jgi:SAM-dependent methyltransferase
VRTVIDNPDFLPQDVRPAELLAQYKALVERDVGALFLRHATMRVASCPGCGAAAAKPAFARYGLKYLECDACGTLWIGDRPSSEVVRSFYRNSEAERFWQTHLARVTAEARIARIVKPRLEWMLDSIQEHRPRARAIADVGTQLDVFAEHLAALDRFARMTVVEPIAQLVAGRLEVIEESLDTAGLVDAFDVVALFDVLDRTSDVEALMGAAHRALEPGGLVFITGILASGFDVQVLWDRAEMIFPPDRLNAFSATGLEALIARHGFDILEFSTPGAFDLKTVARALDADPALPVPRFVSTLLRRRGEDEHLRFQNFLQSALLSSFARVLARKRA